VEGYQYVSENLLFLPQSDYPSLRISSPTFLRSPTLPLKLSLDFKMPNAN